MGGASVLNRYEAVFQRAAAAGINICAASGDNGSTDGVSGSTNYVDFPAASPSVVACGGTKLTCPAPYVYSAPTTRETVWGYSSSNGTGGGVSRLFPKPAYQNIIMPAPTGRAVPDIAMNADPATGVAFRIAGGLYVIGGTSIVAPLMSAFIASLNNPGFMNLKLYPIVSTTNYAICFNDVTQGNNGAYSAGGGYDQCTGLGSLNALALTTNPVNAFRVRDV